ncbi:hypothetical protein AB0K48_47605, partial [Nonomuraea sp. NPDC055795]
ARCRPSCSQTWSEVAWRTDDLVAPYWHLDRPDPASRRTLRRLPALTAPVLRLIWHSGRRPALVILALQLAAGAATASGLLATASVLDDLLAEGAAPERLAAAVPGLALVAAIVALRAAAEAAVELARARLEPALRRAAEERLFAAALGVQLADFDDVDFYDGLHRARDRGLFHLDRAVANTIDLLGAACGVTAAAAGLAVLHPLLVPLLVLSVIPEGWAVLRAARHGYGGMREMVTLNRRVDMLADLATEREPAAEVRACQAQPYALARRPHRGGRGAGHRGPDRRPDRPLPGAGGHRRAPRRGAQHGGDRLAADPHPVRPAGHAGPRPDGDAQPDRGAGHGPRPARRS